MSGGAGFDLDDDGDVHVLTVWNAVDVPEEISSQVLALLSPYAPDVYTRPCYASGRVI